jgi:hypothetical protein
LPRASNSGGPRRAGHGVFTTGAFSVSAIVGAKLAALFVLLLADGHKNSAMSMEHVNVVAVQSAQHIASDDLFGPAAHGTARR